jgi:hypothetical protein
MKRMKHTLTPCLWVAILGLIVAVALPAADTRSPKANWVNLKKLVPGENIRIVLSDAKSCRARFQSLSDEAIGIHPMAGARTFTWKSML